MSATTSEPAPVSAAEAKVLFAGLERAKALVLAVRPEHRERITMARTGERVKGVLCDHSH